MTLLQTILTQGSASSFIGSPETIFQGFLKLLFIVGILIYLIFSVLVIRQINLMSKTIESSASGLMKLLGFAHLAIAIVVFLFYILLL